ncbi:hypothetical protein [Nitrosomonas sp.]|uniref:hypothetical protein n=1 Tax=Nitrosomonas sp. TaxID=42353 RepID=UPI001DB63D82|nr:hypothetical protein [Nitrosomonas sp.]MBX3616841.1 hypothetical protein [Nitrosomonas sp.]
MKISNGRILITWKSDEIEMLADRLADSVYRRHTAVKRLSGSAEAGNYAITIIVKITSAISIGKIALFLEANDVQNG